MSDEATFHDGYRKALEEVSKLVTGMQDGHMVELADLLADLDRMIERARCLRASSLACRASGDAGY
ncbi:MAG: hypothetical protein OER88_00260 [Planctomycetota bacterium]|nr:hypothetical protein [Planctomycetota bacterium]